MEGHTAKSKNSDQKDSNIKVATNWQYTQEPNPAFKQLMMILLRPLDNQPAETIRADEEPQNE